MEQASAAGRPWNTHRPLDHEDLTGIALAVRAEQRSLPPEEIVYIGGDLFLHTLDTNGFHIQHIHRFDDWATDWNDMCTRHEDTSEGEPRI